MINLNKLNGADKILTTYAKALLDIPNKYLIGVEMGSAYGGGIEAVGKLWKDRGTIYGFDTFEGHPKHLVPNQNSLEATCMDNWYKKEVHGTKKLSYEYQRKELDRQELDNVILVKGEVNKDSCRDIPYINYCFLDMDIRESMEAGYAAVRNKVEPGFLLFLHDVTPPDHLPRVYHWFVNEVVGKDGDMWTIMGEYPSCYLTMLRRNE